MKKTGWFRWPAKPARVGLYEFRGLTYDTPVLMMFNGRSFGWPDPGDGLWIDLADDRGDEWRGLRSNVEGEAPLTALRKDANGTD